MSEFTSHRRFYLSKRIAARLCGELALSGLWHSKQEEQSGGPVLPDDFPSRVALAAVGYVAKEDLVGADEVELCDWVKLSPGEAQAVLVAAATL